MARERPAGTTLQEPRGRATGAKASTRPDYERPEYKAGRSGRELCRDLMDGTEAVRAGGKKYLPKWPAEKEKNYEIRASIVQVTRFYQRTVQASVGMICSTPPALDKDADALIAKDWEDIDGKGTHGEVFSKEKAEDMINAGFTAILVDAPPIPSGLELTLADEQALGIRPFWVSVTADRILSWVVEVPNWKTLLEDYAAGKMTAEQVASYAKQVITRQVVLHEPTDVRDGEFGTKCVDRYRILTLTDSGVTFRVVEKTESDGKEPVFTEVAQGVMLMAKGQPFREIPLAVGYGGKKKAAFVANPPLMALAELNLDHYQVSADRRYLMRLCHAPTFTTMGWEPDDDGTGQKKEVEIGPNAWLKLPATGNAKYTAADPAALDSSKDEKEELTRQMATLGMSFLGKDRSMQTETATARALDDAAENASHATVARGLQDLLEQSLKFHAQYRGVLAPSVKVNTTYASPTVDPQIAAVLWQAVVADKLDVESWIEYVKSGNLPDDVKERVELLKLSNALNEDTTTQPADKLAA